MKIILLIFAFISLIVVTSCGNGIEIADADSDSDSDSTSTDDDSEASAGCENDFCYLYVTSAAYLGDETLSGFDSACNSDASRPNSGTYKAVMASSARTACTTANCSGGVSENSDWALSASTEYRRVDGTTVIGTTTAAGIFSFALDNSVNGAGNVAWTGLDADWTNSSDNCTNWTSNSNGVDGADGLSMLTSTDAISVGTDSCDTASRNVYCAEQ